MTPERKRQIRDAHDMALVKYEAARADWFRKRRNPSERDGARQYMEQRLKEYHCAWAQWIKAGCP